jgi:hypothetical protein
MEQYNDGLLIPGHPSAEGRDGRNRNDSLSSDLQQYVLIKQIAHEQSSDVSRGSQDLSAAEGYIPDRHQNNAPKGRNFDLDTANIMKGPRRARRNANYQEPGRWHTHDILYRRSVGNYLKAF